MAADTRMDQLTQDLPTKSAKIRALNAAGYKRADIARYLRVRYQHVYNVLMQPPPQSPSVHPTSSTPPESTNAAETVKVPVGPDGRIVIPTAHLAAMGVQSGDAVLARIVDGELRLASIDTVLRQLQKNVRRHVPAGVSLADELIAERRREAAAE